MARFFLDPDSWGDPTELVGDEAVHCSRVLRAREGDTIEVFDGEGRWANAVITSVARNKIGLKIQEVQHAAKPAVRVVLAQAVLKGKAMDWLIQKAVELGVSAIQPLITDHTVVRPQDAKADKWRRATLEACKQSGQRFLPEVADPIDLGAFLEASQSNSGQLRVVAALAEPRKSLREVISEAEPAEEVIYLVGPEGDLTGAELDALRIKGFQAASLGAQVLRSETAALFGLVSLSYVFA